MTKLLGTFAILILCISSMAQQSKQTTYKKDSVNKYTDSIRSLPPLEVQSIRVRENSPFAKSTLNAANIALVNLGQDLPFLIQSTPSIVANSDAGTGIGYTGLRIRGTDATRINVTLNGIPYNDAESMGTFFVDLPDFSSSANSIQIQRGVGTSTNGASAFGATINIATNDYKPSPYLSLQNSAGSFNTFKNTLNFGTGLLNNRFTIDGRLSNITSDGYIDRAKSDLKSFYLSSTYWGDHSSLRLNVFSGKEKTYQAWYGVPEELLQTQRTYNPAGTEKSGTPYENQTDNYVQTHYQLFYNHTISPYLKWNTAIFLTKGRGYYEEYKSGVILSDYGITVSPSFNSILPDLIRRRWLDNQFLGQIASLSYEKNKTELTLGGGWNQYDGFHFGNLPYGVIDLNDASLINKEYYRNKGIKKEFNAYTKWTYHLNSALSSFVDLQFRQVQHTMNGFDGNPTLFIDRKFNFINPKLGLSYKQNKTTYYASFSVANKEPNRDDFEAGTLQQPSAERLYDFEAGFNQKQTNFNWGLNFYYMDYKDQLVLTGKINDVGAYTRTNVPKSYRAGIEMEGAWQINKAWSTNGNITFSKNKIQDFVEYFDDYDNGGQAAIPHHNTDIALSPNLTAAHSLQYKPTTNWQFIFSSKYVSKQYLDNTQNEERTLNAFFVNDLNVSYKLAEKKSWSALIQFYTINIFDVKYEPNGYTYSYVYGGTTTTSNNYFPMAGRNYLVSLKIDIK
jgi:iron complex outermembrane receptor protein